MRSLEQCTVTVLQGRAGYTTGSQAEDGNRLGSIPLVSSGTGGCSRPLARQVPSAIPWHPRSIPTESRPSGRLRVPGAVAALLPLLSVPQWAGV